jgi:hypothetical protein
VTLPRISSEAACAPVALVALLTNVGVLSRPSSYRKSHFNFYTSAYLDVNNITLVMSLVERFVFQYGSVTSLLYHQKANRTDIIYLLGKNADLKIQIAQSV